MKSVGKTQSMPSLVFNHAKLKKHPKQSGMGFAQLSPQVGGGLAQYKFKFSQSQSIQYVLCQHMLR